MGRGWKSSSLLSCTYSNLGDQSDHHLPLSVGWVMWSPHGFTNTTPLGEQGHSPAFLCIWGGNVENMDFLLRPAETGKGAVHLPLVFWLEPDGYCLKGFLFWGHCFSSPLAWGNRLFLNHFYLCLLMAWVEGFLGALFRIHENNYKTENTLLCHSSSCKVPMQLSIFLFLDFFSCLRGDLEYGDFSSWLKPACHNSCHNPWF